MRRSLLLDIWKTNNRRTDIQIMAEILTISSLNEVEKPQILSTVKISHSQAQKYIKRLLDLRLVDTEFSEKDRVVYKISEKGKKLLINVESIQELLQRNKTHNVLLEMK
jgi:predicted transcriptional regulator